MLAERVRCMQSGYPRIVRRVQDEGRRTAPRGLATIEVRDAVIAVEDPSASLPIGCGRNLNSALGVAEALQLIAGISTPSLLLKITDNLRQFMTPNPAGPGFSQHGAYGPRAGWQMPRLLKRLRDDPDTRQGVITVYDPDLDLVDPPPSDVPCTLALRFGTEHNTLVLTAVMRSNDVWWGLAYDAFQFTQLQLTVARCLDRTPGPYTHVALSLHLYERDLTAAAGLHLPKNSNMVHLRGVGASYGLDWSYYAGRAYQLLQGELPLQATTTELWMHEKLEPYT